MPEIVGFGRAGSVTPEANTNALARALLDAALSTHATGQ